MRLDRVRVSLTVATAALAAIGVAAAAPASAASAHATKTGSTRATESVIVLLRDQLTATPDTGSMKTARSTRAHSSQRAVLARLAGRTPTKVTAYTLVNGFAATVTQAQAAALAADPAVRSVTPDRTVQVTPKSGSSTSATGTGASAALAGPVAGPAAASPTASRVNPAACSTDPSKPVLEPEALQTIRARSDDPSVQTAASLGIDGSGVKVAFIADGINPDNAAFLRKDGKSSIVDYQDLYGDGLNTPTSGAEAFGDASAISAQGNVVYDVAKFSNPAVVSYKGGHCYIRIVGVAPGANLVALKAGSELLPNSAILQSIDYAVTTAKVDVISESFGANIVPDAGTRDAIQTFNDAAVAAGVPVTESTGDAGPTGTIGASATDPLVISTGASTDSRLYEQTGYALAPRFSNGTWADDNISSLSSAGITEDGRTIDVSAPGEADWAACDASGNFSGCVSFRGTYSPIESFGGTSQSAPMTAGVAALVIQAYRKTHSGDTPTPAVVKTIITSTADDLGFDGQVQGTGRIDARSAVEAALTWPGATGTHAALASNIALSTDQLDLQGAPGTSQTGSVTVTNIGPAAQTVVAATRRYAAIGASTQTTTIDAASTQTLPYPTNGTPWAYETRTFTVPTGADVLDAAIRWQSGTLPGGTGPVVRMTLIDPNGTYQANTRPQGGAAPADYGDVLVRRPAAGTWTAILYTPHSGGYTGSVSLAAVPERAVPAGSVSPSPFTLAPGASRAVSVSVPFAALGGDSSSTLSLATSTGRTVAVPIIARTVVPTGADSVGRFGGTITGGNARAYSPAQTFSYAFDVPAGQRDLDVAVTLPKKGDTLLGVLIDPNGETPSISSTVKPRSGSTGRSVQNVVADPQPGRWRYLVDVANPVSGTAFAQTFSGTVAFNGVGATLSGLPSSLPAGQATRATLTVTNPGPAPITVQTDARTTTLQQTQLAPQGGSATIDLPLDVENVSAVPYFLVPPDTRSIALSAASTVPAQVELSSPGFGIDVFGDLAAARAGSTVSTADASESSPAYVGQGAWTTYVQEIGPFGTDGASSGTSTLTASAVTAGFDGAVSSSTGDPYLPGLDPTAPAGRAVVIPPGQSATITVDITPTAASGTTVSGVLNVVTAVSAPPVSFNGTGDVLAALPYSYTVS